MIKVLELATLYMVKRVKRYNQLLLCEARKKTGATIVEKQIKLGSDI